MSSFCFFSPPAACLRSTQNSFIKLQSIQNSGVSLSPQPGNSNHEQKQQEFHFVKINARHFSSALFLASHSEPSLFSKPAVHFPPRSSLLDCLLRFVTRLKSDSTGVLFHTFSRLIFTPTAKNRVDTPAACIEFSNCSLLCNDKRTKSLKE